jgi:two-component system, OmpR family, phosphate regulon sensor histidine kinase PhoR
MYTQGKVHKNDIYLYTFREEHNYFEMEVSYYVDFSNRVRTIVAEMSSILAVLAFTVCIVLIVYILTLRTMVKQRKLSDLKSDFISNITHELKTPLSTIAVASSSLTLDEILTNKERSKELSAIINRQNRLLNQMIDQVLDISTLERSGFSVHKEPVEIVPFIEEVTKAYLLSQDTNSLVLKTEFRVNNGLMVDLDRFQMTRVLNNLLSNAVKYCTRKPEIRVRVFETNKILKIQVSDNGIGIPKEDQKEVFSKFFRCSQSLPKKVKGLGLGLYFVKRIVEAHQGMVTLESNPDKGSTFTIEIPVKTEEHENSTG